MIVKFRGREVEIVEVPMPRQERLAELTDALNAHGKDGVSGNTVAQWRALAGPLLECARMFAPSLTDADDATATLSDLLDIYVAGVMHNNPLRIVREKVDAVTGPAAAAPDPFAVIEKQADGFASLAALTGSPGRAKKIQRHVQILKAVERMHPGSVIAPEANG